ncbi:MAG TPA: hypothetical protein VNM22_05160 [Candidatus Limnocylindrales bacterium]|nr:hypothetical protein [Candidatus Limnocylindrales bacterium]
MLVCISDLHLTDGSTGRYNVDVTTFSNFWDKILEIAQNFSIKEIELVIVGDLLDLLHSTRWLEGPEEAKPWFEKGEEQFKVVEDILNRIFQENQELITYLADTPRSDEVNIKIGYILGDHDWLINRYESLREKVCKELQLNHNPTERFPSFIRREEYHVFARHGHEYDTYHFEGDYDAPSIGDAVAIELISRFPQALVKTLGEKVDEKILQKLRKIEDVRPLLEVPNWISAVADESTTPELAKAIKRCWDDLVDQFNNLAYVQQWYKTHHSWAPLDEADRLKDLLKTTAFSSKTFVGKQIPLSKAMSQFIRGEDRHPREAYNEDFIRLDPIQYIVSGHTHQSRLLSMDRINGIEKLYFNTGTWRSVHTRNKFGRDRVLFTSWQTLNYAIFYKKGEHPSREFEFWSVALR